MRETKRAMSLITCLLLLGIFISFLHSSNVQANTSKSKNEKKYRIAVLQFAEHPALDSSVAGFKEKLENLGFKDGENLEFVIKNSQGDISNAQTIASQFANDDYDLYLAVATPAAQALAMQIKDKPILATAVTDYEAARLVKSNDKPGRNISGTSDLSPIKDQAELIKKCLGDKDGATVSILYTSSEINSEQQARAMQETLEGFSVKVKLFTLSASNEIRQVAETAAQASDAVYVPTDNLLSSSMALLKTVQSELKVPFFAGEKAQIEGGAVATIGIDYHDLGAQTADMAKRILEDGEDISEMAIELSKDNSLYINESSADELGIDLSQDFLKDAKIIK